MNYRSAWLGACFGASQNSKLIDVKFMNHSEPDLFTASMLGVLKADPAVEWITDNDSGELLYYKD